MIYSGKRQGIAALLALIFLAGLSGLALGIFALFHGQMRATGADVSDIRAFYLAEAGRAHARWALTTGEQAVGWTSGTLKPWGAGKGEYVVTTAYSDPPTNSRIVITSDGYVPGQAAPRARRRVVETNITSAALNLSAQPGVAAFAISDSGQDVPDNCRDGDTNSKWKSGENKNASWIYLDYGSQTVISKVTLTNTNNLTVAGFASSNDGVSWTSLAYTESPPGTYNFAPQPTAQYLRLTTGAKDNKPSIGEFETYGTGATLSQGLFSTTY